MKKVAIIVAGGSGSRMTHAKMPKQFLDLAGHPVLWYTLRSFYRAFPDIHIILVIIASHVESAQKIINTFPDEWQQNIEIVIGGDTRFQSVKNGLAAAAQWQPAIYFVHDAVRCLVSPELIRRCAAQAETTGSAIPAVAATDSIRIVHKNGNESVDRNSVQLVQTPQTFKSEILLSAFEQPYSDLFTDEATVVENEGHKVQLIMGEYTNIKITRPVDLVVAERLLKENVPGM